MRENAHEMRTECYAEKNRCVRRVTVENKADTSARDNLVWCLASQAWDMPTGERAHPFSCSNWYGNTTIELTTLACRRVIIGRGS